MYANLQYLEVLDMQANDIELINKKIRSFDQLN